MLDSSFSLYGWIMDGCPNELYGWMFLSLIQTKYLGVSKIVCFSNNQAKNQVWREDLTKWHILYFD